MPIPKMKVSVTYRRQEDLLPANDSKEVYQALKRIISKHGNWKENFILLCVNSANRIINYRDISSGGLTSTHVDVRLVYGLALSCLCTSIIVAHNHPSGNPSPSEADKQITKKLKEVGNLVGIQMLDHLIITDNQYFSFADNGLL